MDKSFLRSLFIFSIFLAGGLLLSQLQSCATRNNPFDPKAANYLPAVSDSLALPYYFDLKLSDPYDTFYLGDTLDVQVGIFDENGVFLKRYLNFITNITIKDSSDANVGFELVSLSEAPSFYQLKVKPLTGRLGQRQLLNVDLIRGLDKMEAALAWSVGAKFANKISKVYVDGEFLSRGNIPGDSIRFYVHPFNDFNQAIFLPHVNDLRINKIFSGGMAWNSGVLQTLAGMDTVAGNYILIINFNNPLSGKSQYWIDGAVNIGLSEQDLKWGATFIRDPVDSGSIRAAHNPYLNF